MTDFLFLLLFFWFDRVYDTGVALAPQTAVVTNVIDGDTIDVMWSDATTARVRYIGINTPEPYAGTAPECFAAEASTFNEALVAGQTVTLVADQEDTDTYGRLLRYVYVDDVFVNAELVASGHARTLSIPPNTKHAQQLTDLAATAERQGLGLWAACTTQ